MLHCIIKLLLCIRQFGSQCRFVPIEMNFRHLLFKFSVCLVWLVGVANGNSPSMDKISLVKIYKNLLAIDTGYMKYPGKRSEKIDGLSKDLLAQYISEDKHCLRCFFKFVGLSFMQITKYLLKLHAHDRIDDTIDTIESLEGDAFAMITAYGNLQLHDEYDMWMLYVYTAKIRSFYNFYRRNDPGISDRQILFNLSDIHENVSKRLETNTNECVPHRLNVTDLGSMLFDQFKTVRFTVHNYQMAVELLKRYRQELTKIMDKNLQLDAFADNRDSYKLNRLFLTDLVMADHNLDNLMSLYDPYIDWGNTKEMIRQEYSDVVDTPMIMYSGMRDLKKYHTHIKNILTVIVLRMLWTHVELLRKKYETKWKFIVNKTFNKKNRTILKIVNKFIRVVNLDANVLDDIVECLSVESWKCIFGHDSKIIYKIINQLNDQSGIFQDLDAKSKHVVGDEQAFSSNVDQLVHFANSAGISTKYTNKKIILNSVMKYNFTRAIIFVNHLEKLCAPNELMGSILNFSTSTTLIPYNDINIEQFLNDQTKRKRIRGQ